MHFHCPIVTDCKNINVYKALQRDRLFLKCLKIHKVCHVFNKSVLLKNKIHLNCISYN